MKNFDKINYVLIIQSLVSFIQIIALQSCSQPEKEKIMFEKDMKNKEVFVRSDCND